MLILGSAANAAVYIVPTDDELIDSADAIVVGSVREMNSRFASNGDIVTDVDVTLERVLKGGDVLGRGGKPTRVRLTQLGGEVGSQFMFVSGAPHLWRDNRALLFLEANGDQWRIWGMELGKFDFVDVKGRTLAVRGAGRQAAASLPGEGVDGRERVRDAAQFIAHIAARSGGRAAPTRGGIGSNSAAAGEPDYFVSTDADSVESLQSAYPPSAYTYGTFRWDAFDRGISIPFYQSGSQPGYDATGAAQRALAAWTNEAGSNITYYYAGTRSVAFAQDGTNAIVFNSSTDVPAGALAFAKWYGGTEHSYKGETFYSITEGDVVVRSGLSVSQKVFDEAVAHELGHTLGFRHSDQGTPSSTAAVMKASLSGNYGATLGPWDVEAAQTVYTGTSTAPACTPPSITQQPQSATITAGQSVTLSTSASGTAPLTFQWYANGAPISGATGSSVTVTPASTSSYYAVVSNACGSATTSTATVTVNRATVTTVKRRDFDANGTDDVFWRNAATGETSLWLMSGATRTPYPSRPSSPHWQPIGIRDFNADGRADLLWWNAGTREVALWFMSGPNVTAIRSFPGAQPNWVAEGAGDFDGNGFADIFWRNSSTGETAVWLVSSTGYAAAGSRTSSPAWQPRTFGDFNGDGRDDILWSNPATGEVAAWLMQGAAVTAASYPSASTAWSVAGSGDFNADGTSDLFWRNASTGETAVWLMYSGSRVAVVTRTVPTAWQPRSFGDYDANGTVDVFWRNSSTGETAIWFMSGATIVSSPGTPQVGDLNWQPVTVR